MNAMPHVFEEMKRLFEIDCPLALIKLHGEKVFDLKVFSFKKETKEEEEKNDFEDEKFYLCLMFVFDVFTGQNCMNLPSIS